MAQDSAGPAWKPEFLGKEGLPWFNVSHTDGWVLCVIDDRPVGGDIQKIPVYREKTVKRYTSQEEWHLLNQQSMKERENSAALLWSMKEAYVKYLGTGLTKEISTIDFSKALVPGIRHLLERSVFSERTGRKLLLCRVPGKGRASSKKYTY